MEYTNIDKKNWKDFFEFVSRRVVGDQLELEIASVDLGDQIEMGWQPVADLSYNPEQNVISVKKENYEHTIRNPEEIVLVELSGAVHAVCVKTADSALEILQFREPLLLERPTDFHERTVSI